MNVLFIPKSNGNPYQTELARCLNEYRVHVIIKNEKKILPILRVIFSTGKPDILHLHWTHTLIKSKNSTKRIIKGIRLIGEMLFLKIAGVRIIWTVHNMSDHDLEKNRFEDLIHRFFSKMCDAIIVHCEYSQKAVELGYKMIGLEKKKIFTIPHGNYIEYYKNDICRNRARQVLGFAKHETVFGFFGNIRTYKGIFNLVSAFQQLKKPSIRLLLAGKPFNMNVEKKLQRIAETDKRISLCLKFIPENKIQIYLNSMDVVVLPFKKVLTSGSALLAMSYKKPVVAPVKGCLNEVLNYNSNFLYNFNEKNALLNAMKKCLCADLPKLGIKNYEVALKADWRFCAKSTVNIYKNILKI